MLLLLACPIELLSFCYIMLPRDIDPMDVIRRDITNKISFDCLGH